MTETIERLSDGLALREPDGRKVAALRLVACDQGVRWVVEGTLPPEFVTVEDDALHLSGVAHYVADNTRILKRRAEPPD